MRMMTSDPQVQRDLATTLFEFVSPAYCLSNVYLYLYLYLYLCLYLNHLHMYYLSNVYLYDQMTHSTLYDMFYDTWYQVFCILSILHVEKYNVSQMSHIIIVINMKVEMLQTHLADSAIRKPDRKLPAIDHWYRCQCRHIHLHRIVWPLEVFPLIGSAHVLNFAPVSKIDFKTKLGVAFHLSKSPSTFGHIIHQKPVQKNQVSCSLRVFPKHYDHLLIRPIAKKNS